MAKIKALFLDIGGVLLTNGWGKESREAAAKKFGLDFDEMDSRHRLTNDTFEVGKLTLKEYLDRVVFYEKRTFTRKQFKKFMFAQSEPFPEMIDLVSKLKTKHKLKVGIVSNEGREVNAYRIRKFKLDSFVDFFISSSFVHLRKPDPDIFRIALDISQVAAKEVLYIEDRPMFVEVAQSLGIHGIQHEDFKSTLAKLKKFGL